MIVLAKALLDQDPNPSEEVIRHTLRGNLCRCGTYPKVVKAIQKTARKMEAKR